MALKDVDEIKSDIDNWDPRNPNSIVPFKEVCEHRLALHMLMSRSHGSYRSMVSFYGWTS